MSVGPEHAERQSLGTRLNAARRLGEHAHVRLSGEIADYFLAPEARLDERTRVTLGRVLTAMVQGIETEIRRHAARVLAGAGRTPRPNSC